MMNRRTVVSTPLAPQALGPYSPAIKCGDMIFVSGQLGIDSQSGELVGPGIAEQADQALRNIHALLDVAQFTLGHVVKTTIYLKSLDDFAAMNEAYARFFDFDPPARACVEVSRLPKDALVEIDAIAMSTK